MKKTIILVTLLFLFIKITAQVGINTTTPDPNAALDIVSTNKGFLPPRVANVAAIATPVTGLMIYDESRQCMRYYNGTIWSDCMGGITPAFLCGDAMTDIDGNTYPTVLIDDQCWMAANLKVSKYPNGNPIPYIDNNATWKALADNNTDDAYSFYGDSNNDGTIDIAHPDYGALYTYAAAIANNWAEDNNANQGICPDGWHLPTDSEWTILITFLGGTSVAGGKMKETGTTHWNSPNTGATNSSGFSGLPSGFRDSTYGTFNDIGLYGYWRSSTESISSSGVSGVYGRGLYYNNAGAGRYYDDKSHGVCVRCVRD
jgi:uncharacterized protein (TIGR02145 family)